MPIDRRADQAICIIDQGSIKDTGKLHFALHCPQALHRVAVDGVRRPGAGGGDLPVLCAARGVGGDPGRGARAPEAAGCGCALDPDLAALQVPCIRRRLVMIMPAMAGLLATPGVSAAMTWPAGPSPGGSSPDSLKGTLSAVRAVEAARCRAGIKRAVVSNFDTRLRPILEGLGLSSLFDVIIVSAGTSSRTL